jgi:hypothetical protein
MNKLRTTLELNTGGLADYSIPVEVAYSVYPGCAQTSMTPAEDAAATIESITVIEADGTRVNADWLVGLLECDEELLNLCMLDWNEDRIAAEEARAEALREERMLAGSDEWIKNSVHFHPGDLA